MWEDGFVDEVDRCSRRDSRTARPRRRALGYQQILAHLRGEMSEEEARAATVSGTRKFARRQDRLFRKDPRIHWLRFDSPRLVDDALGIVSE